MDIEINAFLYQPVLPPNQQRQSTEAALKRTIKTVTGCTFYRTNKNTTNEKELEKSIFSTLFLRSGADLRADEEVEDGAHRLGVGRVHERDVVEVEDERRLALKYEAGVHVCHVRLATEPVNHRRRRRDRQLRAACTNSPPSI